MLKKLNSSFRSGNGEEEYEIAVGVISKLTDSPPLTIGEKRTLYNLVEQARMKNVLNSKGEGLTPSAEAIEQFCLQYGIFLPSIQNYLENPLGEFKEYFNKIRDSCILP